MATGKNSDWFKKEIAPLLTNYEIKYRFFEQGDFGSLDEVSFESSAMGGQIDFWSAGWLGVFVYDYRIEDTVFNILLESHERNEQEQALRKLQEILGI